MTDPSQERFTPRLLWVLAGLTLAWGFNWTAMKVALAEIPVWTFRALSLASASAIMFAWVKLRGDAVAVPRGQWGRLCLLAFLNVTCWNLLVGYGLLWIPSGRGAILAFTMPIWSIPLSVWLLGERLTLRKAAALAMGAGGLVLLLADSVSALEAAPLGSLLVLGAGMTWALGSVLQKRYPVDLQVAPYTAWVMLLGGAPIFVGAALLDRWEPLGELGTPALLGLIYNIVVAYAWAHWAWIRLATSVPIAIFSLSMLVVPMLSVLSGMLLLGERPSWAEYGALALVVGALATVIRR